MECEYCGKVVRTERGLASHLKFSVACNQARKLQQNSAKKGVGKVQSVNFPAQKGKRKVELDNEDTKPPAKTRLVLDSYTLKKRSMEADSEKGMMNAMRLEESRNLAQKAKDWARLAARSGDPDPNSWYNGESSSEDDEVEYEEEVEEEDTVGEEDSVGTQDEEDGVVSDDDAGPAVIVESQEEQDRRLLRREQPWKTFKEYANKAPNNFINLPERELKAIRIMRTLIKKKAPLDTYNEVMAWHLRETGQLGLDESVGQSRHFVSREKLMAKLRKRYHMDHQYARPCTITLPHSKSKIVVWRKQAQDNVLSLLTDPRWKDNDWLYFDQDPFAKPPDNHSFIEDLNTGEAYQATYKKLITKPNQILVAIPLYIDGAVTGQFDKLQVTALKMTIGILNRRARDKEHAWRNLGFVTNYTKEDSRGKKIFVESGHVAAHELYVDGISDDDDDGVGEDGAEVDKAADYHAILSVLLESLKQLIADGMTVDIFYNGKLYEGCELVFFVPFVKCDGDEGDKLCGHYRSRGKDIQQLCRYCQCPTAQTDNPKAKFPYKTEPMLRKLFEERNVQRHKELSQICIDNTFHGLRFGLHNDRGIHGATPWEILHGILLGEFKYVRDCLFAQLGESSATAKEVNALAQEIGAQLQRQSDRDKPRTKFAKGILKGKLMAKEYSGVLLVMAALLQSAKGKALLSSARRKDFRQAGQVADWVLLVETLLQWEAYLTLPQMQKKHVQRLKKKHQYLLYLLKRVGDRQKGMGFKVMKFHAVLHLAYDIMMFGVPMNVDTGSNESHHKTTKIAAKLTQKDVQTFEMQTSNRLDDFHVLELATQEIDGRALWTYSQGFEHEEVPEAEDKGNTTGGMIINVYREKEDHMWSFKVVTRMKERKAVGLDPQFLQYAVAIQKDLAEWIEKIPICAEHNRGGQIFRAHPNYRGKGPWRDWVMIEWNVGNHPAHIWAFMDLTSLPMDETIALSNGTVVHQGVWAVIESCNYVDQEEEDRVSEIFKPIILETNSVDADGNPEDRKFYLVDVETFQNPLVVIPNIGTKCEYLMMTPKAQWGEDFVKWIEAPHTYEEAEMREVTPVAAAAAATAARTQTGSTDEDSDD